MYIYIYIYTIAIVDGGHVMRADSLFISHASYYLLFKCIGPKLDHTKYSGKYSNIYLAVGLHSRHVTDE
jgi:hypothetical protein